MKKTIKIIALAIVILLIAAISSPFIFKTQITNIVKTELGEQLEAEVQFGSVNISVFKNFPNLSLTLNDLSIVKNTKDTLISMTFFGIDMQAWNAITKKELLIKSIVLNNPRINYIASPVDSTLNEPIEKTDTSTSSTFKVVLNQFSIVNGMISYLDSTTQMSAKVEGINMILSGDFSAQQTLLNIDLITKQIFFSQNNETLLKGFPAHLKASIDADLKTQYFTFKENSLNLGVLKLELDGALQLLSDKVSMDLRLNAPVTDMSDLLNMIPESYANLIPEGMKTDGKIAIAGELKGDYVDIEHLPYFNFLFSVKDGEFQYPELPKSINDINIIAKIIHPDQSNADKTVVVVDKFACNIGTNPIDSKWRFSTPVSDLLIDGYFKGNINLGSLKDVIPIEDSEIEGDIEADINLKGHMSAIEKEEYANFDASGYMKMNDFWFKSNDVPQGISIKETSLAFSPKEINLKSFSAQMGQSDFTLSGKISNYINYVFSEGTLKGNFNHYSNYLNANEFLDQDDNATAETSDSLPSSPFIVPDKLNMRFNSHIKSMLFDNLKITDTRGIISIKDRKAILDGLKMNLLDGSMAMTGVYNSQDTNHVFSDMRLDVKDLDVAKTTKSFSSIKKLAPIATYAEGRISLNMDYYTPFMKNGEINLDKMTSNGYLTSPSLLLKNNSALDELAKVTQNPRYKNLKTGAFKANYHIKNGKVVVDPFKVRVEDKNMELWGEHSLTNIMDYRIKTTIAANELGKDVANLVKLVSDPKKQLPVTIVIKGDLKKPKITVDAKEALKQLQKDASKGLFNGLF